MTGKKMEEFNLVWSKYLIELETHYNTAVTSTLQVADR